MIYAVAGAGKRRTAKNCSDIFVEVCSEDIVLWQRGTYENADGKIVNDQIQITSLADCCRLIKARNHQLSAQEWVSEGCASD